MSQQPGGQYGATGGQFGQPIGQGGAQMGQQGQQFGQGGGGQMGQSGGQGGPMDLKLEEGLTDEMRVVLHDLVQSATTTEWCAERCVDEGPEMSECLRLCRDVADLATLNVQLISRDSIFGPEAIEVFASAAEACAQECARHGHRHCQECAEVLSRAVQSTRKMLASFGEGGGGIQAPGPSPQAQPSQQAGGQQAGAGFQQPQAQPTQQPQGQSMQQPQSQGIGAQGFGGQEYGQPQGQQFSEAPGQQTQLPMGSGGQFGEQPPGQEYQQPFGQEYGQQQGREIQQPQTQGIQGRGFQQSGGGQQPPGQPDRQGQTGGQF